MQEYRIQRQVGGEERVNWGSDVPLISFFSIFGSSQTLDMIPFPLSLCLCLTRNSDNFEELSGGWMDYPARTSPIMSYFSSFFYFSLMHKNLFFGLEYIRIFKHVYMIFQKTCIYDVGRLKGIASTLQIFCTWNCRVNQTFQGVFVAPSQK